MIMDKNILKYIGQWPKSMHILAILTIFSKHLLSALINSSLEKESMTKIVWFAFYLVATHWFVNYVLNWMFDVVLARHYVELLLWTIIFISWSSSSNPKACNFLLQFFKSYYQRRCVLSSSPFFWSLSSPQLSWMSYKP